MHCTERGGNNGKKNQHKIKNQQNNSLADRFIKKDTLPSAKLSLLFLLALNGSVDHEVGQVDVALGFFRLRHNTESDADH